MREAAAVFDERLANQSTPLDNDIDILDLNQ